MWFASDYAARHAKPNSDQEVARPVLGDRAVRRQARGRDAQVPRHRLRLARRDYPAVEPGLVSGDKCLVCQRFGVRLAHARRDLRVVAMKIPNGGGAYRDRMLSKVANLKAVIADETRLLARHEDEHA